MEKSVHIKIYGKDAEIKGIETNRFRRFCEYKGLLAWGAVHKVDENFRLCEVKTSCGPMIMIVCEDCFNEIKTKSYFIREVFYEVSSSKQRPSV